MASGLSIDACRFRGEIMFAQMVQLVELVIWFIATETAEQVQRHREAGETMATLGARGRSRSTPALS